MFYRYFFIDTFLNVPSRFSLLNIEANKDLSSIKMPSFIEIEKDVTGNFNDNSLINHCPDKLEYTSYNVSLEKVGLNLASVSSTGSKGRTLS